MFVELDCGDDGAPLVTHFQSPCQMFEFSLLSKVPKSADELFSATEQLISGLKGGLRMQCL
jgi:hypothetical protein